MTTDIWFSFESLSDLKVCLMLVVLLKRNALVMPAKAGIQ